MPSKNDARSKRVVGLLGVLAIAVIAVIWMNRDFLFNAATETDSLQHAYSDGDLSATATAIRESESADGDSWMLAANCYRLLGWGNEFRNAIDQAQQLGVDRERLQQASELFDAQAGNFSRSSTATLLKLKQQGVPEEEARRAVIIGSLMRGDSKGAKELLDSWHDRKTNSNANSPEPGYLRAMLARAQSQWSEVETRLLNSITNHPQHELSYLALADLYSNPPNTNLEKCRLVYEQCLRRFPSNQGVSVQLARVYRKLGDCDSASEVLRSQEPTASVMFERAQIALDAGRYEESVDWLQQGGLSSTTQFVSMIDTAFLSNLQGTPRDELLQSASLGAIALSLVGRSNESQSVFHFLLDRKARASRLLDLQIQRELFPKDKQLAQAIDFMALPATQPGCATLVEPPNGAEGVVRDGDRLYAEHCSSCHGKTGDGWGASARHLFPAPRSFREEPIRIISTINRNASDQDLFKTIRKGLQGVSMPAFPQLSDDEIAKLILVVRSMQTDGLQDQYQRKMRKFEPEERGPQDQVHREQWIKQRISPSNPLPIPALDDFRKASADNGQLLFVRAGCKQCHAGELDTVELNNTQPRLDGQPRLFDTLGRPIAIRRLAIDPFRGGNSREEIYKRVVLGIPGTPHPSISGLTEAEIVDLVQFVFKRFASSNHQEHPVPATTNFQRRINTLGMKNRTTGGSTSLPK